MFSQVNRLPTCVLGIALLLQLASPRMMVERPLDAPADDCLVR